MIPATLARQDFSEARVLVTGGASGIGRAIVDEVIAQGGRAIVWDVQDDALAAAAATHGDALMTAHVDVSDVAAVSEAMKSLPEAFRPTHLVNNAGIIGRVVPIADLPPDEIERVFAVNVKSVLYCTQAFLSHRSPCADAAIVNLSSIAARTGGMPGNALYATTKGAIASLTRAAAKELAPAIRVNALAPGIIDTPIQGDSLGSDTLVATLADAIPLKRVGDAGEVAAAAVWLLSPSSSYITGTVLDVAGGR